MRLAAPEDASAAWMDIEAEEARTPPEEPQASDPSPPRAAEREVAIMEASRKPAKPPIPASDTIKGTVASDAPSAAAAAAADRASGAWTLSITTGGQPPGLGPLVGDRLAEAVRAGIGATVAEAREAEAQAAILHGDSARDIDLGLTPGGELVTIAREAAHRSLIPTSSRGVLQFETDAAGVVTRGRVIDASSGRADWEELATEVVTLSQGKPLRLASGKAGVVVTIEVTSALKSIDGVTQTGKHTVASSLGAIAGAMMNPIGAVTSHAAPLLRVVSAHIVEVRSR